MLSAEKYTNYRISRDDKTPPMFSVIRKATGEEVSQHKSVQTARQAAARYQVIDDSRA